MFLSEIYYPADINGRGKEWINEFKKVKNKIHIIGIEIDYCKSLMYTYGTMDQEEEDLPVISLFLSLEK